MQIQLVFGSVNFVEHINPGLDGSEKFKVVVLRVGRRERRPVWQSGIAPVTPPGAAAAKRLEIPHLELATRQPSVTDCEQIIGPRDLQRWNGTGPENNRQQIKRGKQAHDFNNSALSSAVVKSFRPVGRLLSSRSVWSAPGLPALSKWRRAFVWSTAPASRTRSTRFASQYARSQTRLSLQRSWRAALLSPT